MFATKLKMILATLAIAVSTLTAAPSFAEGTAAPTTVAEHQARANTYKEQAAQYRKAAEEHKQMAAEYAKKNPDMKTQKNPSNEKMQKHCMMLAKDYEKLAADADKAAEYHEMRAKEMEGK
jgi:outer membrane lipoprotein-sorting protein